MDPIVPDVPPNDLLIRYGFDTFGRRTVHEERWRGRKQVQARPFNKVTTLTVNHQRLVRNITDPEYGSSASIDDGENPGTYLAKVAYNKAYAKLMDDVNSSQSQLAATLFEGRKTIETINNRSTWLLNHFRKRVKRERNRFGKTRSIASMFIEYRWVYAATIGDIYNAVSFLQEWEPKTAVKGKGKANDGYMTKTPLPGLKPGNQWHVAHEEARVLLKSQCKITNPNLFWASQMGLTNPAALAWELTKFSWLADWFGTLGEVLNSWDDRLGLEFVNPCRVVHRSMEFTKDTHVWFAYRNRYAYTSSTVIRTEYERDPTLGSGPFLIHRQIKSPSLVRGATAIALLAQMLGGKR